jgi:chloramphenicol O-acetyltransferase type A
MQNFSVINIDDWSRKNTYNFYKGFDDPYFNFTTNLNVTGLLHSAKLREESFFLSVLHCALTVANEIENFKIRSQSDNLFLFDQIDGGSTLLYDDESFGFGYYDYHKDRSEFIHFAQAEIENRKSKKSFEPSAEKINLIYFSSIPWFSFTSTKHAQHHTVNNSIPRITFGKYFEQGEDVLMPMNIEVNHAIMDGLHLGIFFSKFEALSR